MSRVYGSRTVRHSETEIPIGGEVARTSHRRPSPLVSSTGDDSGRLQWTRDDSSGLANRRGFKRLDAQPLAAQLDTGSPIPPFKSSTPPPAQHVEREQVARVKVPSGARTLSRPHRQLTH